MLPDNLAITGAVLSDQVKNLDWQARNAVLICALPDETVTEILQKLNTLLAFDDE